MDIGNDPDSEVLIFSGTGDKWIGGFDRELAEQPIHEMPSDAFYDHIYWDATKLPSRPSPATRRQSAIPPEWRS
jgi:hypothetical protein